jgi:two-component system, cell cycle sensor histidine kinase and response regulator CckA
MINKENVTSFRQQAEAIDHEKEAHLLDNSAVLSPEETRQTLQELRVHKIELEMQNEELRRAQAHLGAAQARYFDLYELAPVGYFSLSEQGLILDANLNAATLLGVVREAMIQQPINRFIHKDYQDLNYRLRKLLFETGDPQACELRMVKMDRKKFWAHLAVTAEQSADGAPLCRVVMIDIEERKQAEESLQRSETLYRSLVDNIPQYITRKDRKGRFTFANKGFSRMLGKLPEEILGKTDFDFYSGNLAEKYRNDDRHVMETQKVFETEEENILPNEEHRYVHAIKTPIIDPDGQIVGVQCVFEDITERKRSEAQIKKLSSAVEQSPASIVITDLTGAIEYVNPSFTRITGYTLEEVRGQNPRVLKGDKTSPDEYLRLWECITHGREWHGEFHNRKKNGHYYWESASISPIVDSEGHATHFLAVKEDITERKALEEQFRQSQKLEAIGQLAGGVAHDFNNILAVIMVQLSFLQRNSSQDAGTQESLTELIEEVKRAAKLPRQLLMFSRRSVMDVELLDLNELVANLLKMLGRLIGEHITVRFDRCEVLPSVEADAGMMEQVVMNLSLNARDAMRNGGSLTINIEPVQVDEERVHGNITVPPGQFACLSVADTGCGMDEATLKRIFEPFFTTKEIGKGTGLGLATVHGIVAQHKGWVEVESELGKGTTFKVFLPAATKRKAEPIQTEKMAVIRGHETILLVEDETNLRLVVAKGLRVLGYCVLEADNGQTAMKLWQEHDQKIDLLFSDLMMPEGMTGLDLAEKLKKEKPNLKVIISSGYNLEMAGEGMPTGGDIVYCQKPYQFEILSKTIRDCLDRA